jgi:AraC-like DNA-binding protein
LVTSTAVSTADTSSLVLDGLRADGPYPAWRDQLMLFGQFVGVWDMDVEYYDRTGACTHRATWEWSFDWILGGRAIQDIIVRLDPAGDTAPQRTAGGTTVRYCDPDTGQWTVYFLGAVTGNTVLLRGGAVGDAIILEGTEPNGTHNRWTFTDIRAGSFTWTGVESADGTAWWRNQQMLGRRRTGEPAGTDPAPAQVLQRYAATSPRPVPADWLDLFRHVLAEALDDSTPSLDTLSRRLTISIRTLQRRLADHGTTWRAELDTARRNRAQQTLQNSTPSMTRLARQLGYSDPTSARRALRRWNRRNSDPHPDPSSHPD